MRQQTRTLFHLSLSALFVGALCAALLLLLHRDAAAWPAMRPIAQATDARITVVKQATPAEGDDFLFYLHHTFVRAWGWDVNTGPAAPSAFENCIAGCFRGVVGANNGQFSTARAVAIAPDGSVYVADFDNHRIQKFTSDGVYVAKWGSFGSANGQFKYPSGVAVDSAGNVYVVERDNPRVQKFNSSGSFLLAWGTLGFGNGQFNKPTGVAVDGADYIYVADTSNHRIQKFNTSGAYITQWGTFGSGDGQFRSPGSIAADAAGNIYVADTSNHRIQKFTNTGGYLGQWGSNGTGPGQFNFPFAVAADSTPGARASIFVADTINHRIQKFDAAGNFVEAWGSSGTTAARFNSPYGIAVDPHPARAGWVYVADSFNHRIQKFYAPTVVVDDASALPGGSDGDAYAATASFIGLAEGTYTVTEVIPFGWYAPSVSCVNSSGGPAGTINGAQVRLSVVAGSRFTCTYANEEIDQTLTVNKIVNGGGPLGPNDFPLFIDGSPVGRGVPVELPVGMHTVSETGDSRYTPSFGGACNMAGQVNLGLDQDLTCTVVNTYITQTLTVHKAVVGGPLGPDDFSLFIDGSPVNRGAAVLLENGSYTVSETPDPRYTATIGGACNSSGQVNLGIGQHLACTITNTYIPQFVTVEKVVVGGPLSPDEFDLFIDGNPITRGVPVLLENGSYTVSETPDPRYTTSIGGACNSSGQVNLGIGQSLTCTIINTYIPQYLTVEKVVVGGPLAAHDFTLLVDGAAVPRGMAVEFEAGLHRVSESAVPSYAVTFGGACDSVGRVNLGIGASLTCTITNTYVPQSLIVHKVVQGGGPLGPDDFALFVDGVEVARGLPVGLDAGMHTVSETLDPRYTTEIGGACNSAGDVMLAPGEFLSCTITNTYIPQFLQVDKVVVGGGPLAATDFTPLIDGVPVAQSTPILLESGLHTVGEIGHPDYAPSFGGDCDAAGQIHLGIGESRTCVITNTYVAPAILHITKTVVGQPPGFDWPFGLTGLPQGFAMPAAGGTRTFTLTPGTITLDETIITGYQSSAACTNGAQGESSVSFTLAHGEEVACEFTNTRLPASIEFTKTVSLQPDTCGEEQALMVEPGTPVYYCLSVRNTSQFPLNRHTMSDPGLGLDLTLDFDLNPGEVWTTVANAIVLSDIVHADTDNTARWTARRDSFVATERSSTSVQVARPEVRLLKLVGTDTTGCGGSNLLTVEPGSVINYCLVIRNDGNITLTEHALSDPRLGIEETIQVEIPPGEEFEVTRERIPALGPLVLTQPMTNTASVISTFGPFTAGAEATAVARFHEDTILYLPSIHQRIRR